MVHTFFPDANRNILLYFCGSLKASSLIIICYCLWIIYYMPDIVLIAFLLIHFFHLHDDPVKCCCYYCHLLEAIEAWKG